MVKYASNKYDKRDNEADVVKKRRQGKFLAGLGSFVITVVLFLGLIVFLVAFFHSMWARFLSG